MRSWSRMQDVVAIVIGAFAALSPLWLDTNNAAMWSLIVLGVLVALSGLVHMSRPEMTVPSTRWPSSECCCSSPRG